MRRTAIILAGGQSRRMGQDKALLDVGGQPLIQRVIDRLGGHFSDILISGAGYEQFGLPVVPDAYEGAGSLGGICSAVAASPTDHAFVVACDMPFVNLELIRHLETFTDSHDVVIARLERGLETLHAFYSKGCVPAMRRSIEGGDLKIISFFDAVRVKVIEPDDWRRLDPEGLSFFNVNTPAEYDRALALLHERRP